MDSGGGVLLDDDIKLVSSGILGLGDVRSSPSDEGVGVRLVTTGGDEGTNGGGATDGEQGTWPTVGQGGRLSCLFTQDLQGLNGPESLSFLAGRRDRFPKSTKTLG